MTQRRPASFHASKMERSQHTAAWAAPWLGVALEQELLLFYRFAGCCGSLGQGPGRAGQPRGILPHRANALGGVYPRGFAVVPRH